MVSIYDQYTYIRFQGFLSMIVIYWIPTVSIYDRYILDSNGCYLGSLYIGFQQVLSMIVIYWIPAVSFYDRYILDSNSFYL